MGKKQKKNRESTESTNGNFKKRKIEDEKVKRTPKEAKETLKPKKNPSRSFPTDPEKLLEWIIAPITLKEFFEDYWEKKPLIVKREDREYFKDIFSFAQLEQQLEAQEFIYGQDINVSVYTGLFLFFLTTEGRKKVLNKEGSASLSQIQKRWKTGATLQVLQPQHYAEKLWEVLSLLEEFFQTLVGCNAYLTPPHAQGLAPHFDDVEVFIFQLEGRKHWDLWAPPQDLPAESSPDFLPGSLGPPLLSVDLAPGDLLYFPRGTPHQGTVPVGRYLFSAKTFKDEMSHHVTISTYQKVTWGSFFQTAVGMALHKAFEGEVRFREGLPINFLGYLGTAFSESHDPKRKVFKEKFEELWKELGDSFVDLDATADEISIDFMSNRIPPPPANFPKIPKDPLPSPIVSLRWRNPRWVRMTVAIDDESEEPIVCLWSSLKNSHVTHMSALEDQDPLEKSLKLPGKYVGAISLLFTSSQEFVNVKDLPELSEEEQTLLANLLWEEKLIQIKT